MKSISSLIRTEEKSFPEAVNAFLPRSALVPVNQVSKKKYRCIVSKGDTVKEGQTLAVPLKNKGGSLVSTINAPFPGEVAELVQCRLPDGRLAQAVKINVKGAFSYLGKKLSPCTWQDLSEDEILNLLFTKGVTNTFFKEESLVQQILSCKIKRGRYLVVRMFDEDPSRLTDIFIAKTYTQEVTEGAAIVAKAMKAQGIVFLVPKKSGISIDNELVKDFAVLTVDADSRKYPAGFMQNIISTVRKTVKNAHTDFFSDINTNCIFVDTETLFAVYEAVVYKKPVMERFIHVSGTCLRAAAMFRVKIGTSIEELARQCGGFRVPPAKIIINGMIVGTSVDDLSTPVTRDVKSLMFVPATQLYNQSFSPCVQCGKCRTVCPEQLFPDLLAYKFLLNGSIEQELEQTWVLCSQCGCCNSICPSRIPLSQIISLFTEESKA